MKPQEKEYFVMLVKDYDDSLVKEEELRVKYRKVCREKTERGEEIHTLRREKQERGNEIRTLRREKQERGNEIRTLRCEKQERENEIRRQEQEIKTLEKEKAELERTVASIRASFSYRFGRAVTKPFRWIKSRLKA